MSVYSFTGSSEFFSTSHPVNATFFENAVSIALSSAQVQAVHVLNAYDVSFPVCRRPALSHTAERDCECPPLPIGPVAPVPPPPPNSSNTSSHVAATIVVFSASDGGWKAHPLYGVMRRPELHTRLLANLRAFHDVFERLNVSVVFPVDQCALEQSPIARVSSNDRFTELDLSTLWTSPWYRRTEESVKPLLDLRLRCSHGCRGRLFNADGKCRYDTCSGRGNCSEERGINGNKRAVCADCPSASGARCQATKRSLDGSQFGLFEPLQWCSEEVTGEQTTTTVSLETMTASDALGGAQLLFYAGPLVPETPVTQSANASVMVALLLVPDTISNSYKPVLAVGSTANPVVVHFREFGDQLQNPEWHRIDVEVSQLIIQ